MQNRNFTTTEEADLSCFKHFGVFVEFHKNIAEFHHEDGASQANVFAINDNLYLVTCLKTPTVVHTFENLSNAMYKAVEICEAED